MSTEIISLDEARDKDLKFYFTGKLCRHGHVALRRTADRGCIACRSRIDKNSYYKHQDKRVAKTKRWRKANPERCAEIQRENIESGRAAKAVSKWQKNHRDDVNSYRRRKTEVDIGFKIRINLSNRISQAVRYVWGVKSARTRELLGCTIDELRIHLELQFLPGMSWDNYGYGNDKWHIDHKIPCASFYLTDPEQQRQCFHFTNLQPLWQPDNFRKNKRAQWPASQIG